MKDKLDPRSVPPTPQGGQNVFKPVHSVNDLEDCLIQLVTELTEYPAQSYLDFKAEQEEPSVVIAPGALQPDPQRRGVVKSGYGLNAYPGSVDNTVKFACVLHGAMDIRCVSRSARHARAMADDVGKLMMTLEYFMPEMSGVLSFRLAVIQEPKKVEDTEHLWYAAVQCRYSLEYAWTADRLAPRWKTQGDSTLTIDNIK